MVDDLAERERGGNATNRRELSLGAANELVHAAAALARRSRAAPVALENAAHGRARERQQSVHGVGMRGYMWSGRDGNCVREGRKD